MIKIQTSTENFEFANSDLERIQEEIRNQRDAERATRLGSTPEDSVTPDDAVDGESVQYRVMEAAMAVRTRKNAAVAAAEAEAKSASEAREKTELDLIAMSGQELKARQRLDESCVVHPSKTAHVECAAALCAVADAHEDLKVIQAQLEETQKIQEHAKHTSVEGLRLWNELNDSIVSAKGRREAIVRAVVADLVDDMISHIEDARESDPGDFSERPASRAASQMSTSLFIRQMSSSMSEGLVGDLPTIDDELLHTDDLELALSDIANVASPPPYLVPILNEMKRYMETSQFHFEPGRSLDIDDMEVSRLLTMKVTFLFLSELISKQVGICKVLSGLAPEDIVRLVDICKLVCVDEGFPLFEQNSEGFTFGIVVSGYLRVFYNRRPVSALIRGQVFCDLGLVQQHPDTQIRGASFTAAVRTFVIEISYTRFMEYIKSLGGNGKYELQLKSHLQQSDSIGRENWSQYGNLAKSIEIPFMEFMCRKVGILGLFTMVEIRQLASISEHIKLKPGEMLCREGMVADSIYVILNGAANVFIAGRQVAVALRGQEMGEMGLIGQFAAVRTASVQAHTDMDVAVIPYGTFMSFVASLPASQAQRVSQFVATMALPKYLHLQKLSEELGRKLMNIDYEDDVDEEEIFEDDVQGAHRNAHAHGRPVRTRMAKAKHTKTPEKSPERPRTGSSQAVEALLAFIRTAASPVTNLPRCAPTPPRFSPDERRQMKDEMTERAARNVRRRLMIERNPVPDFKLFRENRVDRRYTPDPLVARRPQSAARPTSRPVSAVVFKKFQQMQQEEQQHQSEVLWGTEGRKLVKELRQKVGVIRRAFQATPDNDADKHDEEEAATARVAATQAVLEAESAAQSAWQSAGRVGVTREVALESVKEKRAVEEEHKTSVGFEAAASEAVSRIVAAASTEFAVTSSPGLQPSQAGGASEAGSDADALVRVAKSAVDACVMAACTLLAGANNTSTPAAVEAQSPAIMSPAGVASSVPPATPRPPGSKGWVDPERDNELDRGQFVSRLRTACSLSEGALGQLFDALDSSVSGHVTFTDLRLFLSHDTKPFEDVMQRSTPAKSCRPYTAGGSPFVPRLNLNAVHPPPKDHHRPKSAVLRPFQAPASSARQRPKTARPNVPESRLSPESRLFAAAPKPLLCGPNTQRPSSAAPVRAYSRPRGAPPTGTPHNAMPHASPLGAPAAPGHAAQARPRTAKASPTAARPASAALLSARPPVPRPSTARSSRTPRPETAGGAAKGTSAVEGLVIQARRLYFAKEYAEARALIEEALASAGGDAHPHALISHAQVNFPIPQHAPREPLVYCPAPF